MENNPYFFKQTRKTGAVEFGDSLQRNLVKVVFLVTAYDVSREFILKFQLQVQCKLTIKVLINAQMTHKN